MTRPSFFVRTLGPLALLGALLSGTATASAGELPAVTDGSVAVSEEARQRFDAGVGFLEDPDGARYEPALAEFMAAYAASPSWKILSNLGLCALKLERQGLALEAYERYLAQGGADIDPDERAQIEKDVALLKSGSTTVTLSAEGASGEIELIDRRVKATGTMAINRYTIPASGALELLVSAGQHEMEARSGDLAATWQVNLEPRASVAHTFTLESGGPPPGPGPDTGPAPDGEGGGLSTLQTVGLVTASVGGLALIGGVITGAIGSGKLSDLESSCPNQV